MDHTLNIIFENSTSEIIREVRTVVVSCSGEQMESLKFQHQRLLLLRHAYTCRNESDICPVTPHCANMKELWKHMKACRHEKCKEPNCLSSRFVLYHHHKCADRECLLCAPVRQVVWKKFKESEISPAELKQGSLPLSSIAGLPSLSLADVRMITYTQLSYLFKKWKVVSEAASRFLSKLSPENLANLPFKDILAGQRVEAERASVALDLKYGIVGTHQHSLDLDTCCGSKVLKVLSSENDTSAAESQSSKMQSHLDRMICPICLDTYVEATTYSCGHRFCFSCSEKWLERSKTCPTCRKYVDYLVPCVLTNMLLHRIMSSRSIPEGIVEEYHRRLKSSCTDRNGSKRSIRQVSSEPTSPLLHFLSIGSYFNQD